MKKYSKVINIHVPIYNTNLIVSYNQTDNELIKTIGEAEYIPKKEHQELINFIKGYKDSFVGLYINNGKNHIIRLKEENEIWKLIDTTSHEVLHFVFELLKIRGIKHCTKSEEAYTYLNGFLMGEIYHQLIQGILDYQNKKIIEN